MSRHLDLPLMAWTDPSAERAAARRERELFDADNAQGDADVADYERSQALRQRGDRRERRANECGAVAAVYFVCLGAMVLPSVVAHWPLESLLTALSIGAVAGIRKGASRGAWW